MLRNQAFYKLEDIYKDFWNFEITDRVCFFRWFTLNLAYFDIFKKFLNRSYQRKRIPHTNFTKPCFLQTRRHIQRFLKFWENWHGSFFRRFTPNLAYFDIFENFSIDPISNKKFRIQILQNHVFYKLKDIYKDFRNFEKTDTLTFFRGFTPNLVICHFQKYFSIDPISKKRFRLRILWNHVFFYKLEDIYEDFWYFEKTDKVNFFADLSQIWHILVY